MRENFATRILVRYTLNVWRMLVPEATPAPSPPGTPAASRSSWAASPTKRRC